jgi:hypothetical protein
MVWRAANESSGGGGMDWERLIKSDKTAMQAADRTIELGAMEAGQ